MLFSRTKQDKCPLMPSESPAEDAPLLQIVDLKSYLFTRGRVLKAVDQVNLTIRQGEAVGLVGESGSGKTMLGLSIMRLLPRPVGRIVGGNIFFKGKDVLALPEREMQKLRGCQIAMILQDPLSSLNPVLTIGDQMGEPLREHRVIQRQGIPDRVRELLRMVHISLPERRVHSYPHQFSGGMRQRVVGALAFSCVPELIIADEPTTALDETIQAQYLRLLKNLQREHNKAMLFVTHDFGIVAKLCDRIAVMYGGRIVEQGTVRDVFTDPAHPYTRALLSALPSPFHDVERLPSIPGQPPALNDLPPGCAFAPRCENPMPECTEMPPEEIEIKPGRIVRCWLYGSRS